MARRQYEELFHGTARFSRSTRRRLERAVGRVLLGGRTSAVVMRSVVASATAELLAQGLDAVAALAVLGSVVEDAGRGCGADRSSLVSGEPVWLPVRTRVLASAAMALEARPA